MFQWTTTKLTTLSRNAIETQRSTDTIRPTNIVKISNLKMRVNCSKFRDHFNGIFIERSIIALNGAIEQRHGSAAILAFCHPHEVCLSRVKALDTDWRRTQKVEKRAARTANGSPTTNESEVRSFARKIIRGTKRGRQGRDRVQTARRNRA